MLRRPHLSLRTVPLAGLVLAVAATLAPAAPATSARAGDGVPVVKHVGPTSFAKPGPYGVGEATLELPGNDAAVVVWYPARRADVKGKPIADYDVVDWLPAIAQSILPDEAAATYPSGGVKGVPVAKGEFPLVVFSHGYAGFPTQSSFLTAWLASWGFVVAAPDHRSRDLASILGAPEDAPTDVADLRATITLMTKEAQRRHGRFAGRIDPSRVGAVGHSAGGAAVVKLAAADRRVDTFVAMAGASTEGGIPKVPGLVLAGDADQVVGLDRLKPAYAALRAPKQLVVLAHAGHHAFSDLCEVGDGAGGLVGLADQYSFPISDKMKLLATDGCNPPAIDATKSWPVVRQATVAQLRRVLGIDRSARGLAGLRSAYPGIVASSTSKR